MDTATSLKYLESLNLPLSVFVTKKSAESILPPKRIKREPNDSTTLGHKSKRQSAVGENVTKNDYDVDIRRFDDFEQTLETESESGIKGF